MLTGLNVLKKVFKKNKYRQLKVNVCVDANGVLKTVVAEGHAGEARAGENLVCAASTVLLRSVYEAITTYKDVVVEGRAEKPGLLNFSIVSYAEPSLEKLKALSELLILGFRRLELENPSIVIINIETGGGNYGT